MNIFHSILIQWLGEDLDWILNNILTLRLRATQI
jgi:hypothetical protein